MIGNVLGIILMALLLAVIFYPIAYIFYKDFKSAGANVTLKGNLIIATIIILYFVARLIHHVFNPPPPPWEIHIESRETIETEE